MVLGVLQKDQAMVKVPPLEEAFLFSTLTPGSGAYPGHAFPTPKCSADQEQWSSEDKTAVHPLMLREILNPCDIAHGNSEI